MADAKDKTAAEKKDEAAAYLGPRLPAPAMVMASAQYEQQQLAREIAEREADPLDEAKVPGGLFLNEAGERINSAGQFIDEDGKVVEKAQKPKAEK